MSDEIQKGQIKFYNADSAYGFITPANGGKDVFFHITGLKGKWEPKNEDQVEFVVVMGKKGPEASQVAKAGASSDDDMPADFSADDSEDDEDYAE